MLMFKLSSATELILCNSAKILRLSITNTSTKNTLSTKPEIFLLISKLTPLRGKKKPPQCHRINELQDLEKATSVITAAVTCNMYVILKKKYIF